MRKLQLFINKYYLQVSWHDMDLKLTLEILFDKSSWPMILSTWSRDFFKKYVLFGKFCTTFLQNLLHWKVKKFKYWHFYCYAISRSSCTYYRKSHVTTFMTSSWDPIYPGVTLMSVSNWYHAKIFANSMYKRVITRCA